MKLEKAIPVLYVSDIATSLSFYTDILGFEDKWEWGSPPTFGGVVRGNVELFFSTDKEVQSGNWIYLIVNDIDTYYNTLLHKGVNIISPPENKKLEHAGDARKDPDGYTLCMGHGIECEPEE